MFSFRFMTLSDEHLLLASGWCIQWKEMKKKVCKCKNIPTKEKKPKERNFILMKQTTADEFFTRLRKMKAYMVVDAFFFFRICTK